MPSREEKKAATRKKLLDAAAALVARNGALATSLDAIAEKAGMTKGAVYSNFASKEDLIDALADRAGPTVNFDAVWDDTKSLADNLEELGRAASRELASVSRRAWQLGIEMLHYALVDAAMRRKYAAEQAEGHANGTAHFTAMYDRMSVRPYLAPAELDLVLNALALGLAQRRAINPSLVTEDLFAKAFRLLAS